MTARRVTRESAAITPQEMRRINLTVSGRDADDLPRVPRAGQFGRHKGHDVQIMHNGVRVLRGGYYGEWVAELIRQLRGVHEPQEEKAVAAVIDRLVETRARNRQPVVVELGSYWAFYSLWFLDSLPDGKAVCLEPDPQFMEVGVTNFMLNDREGTFFAGAVGTVPDTEMDFVPESDGVSRPVPAYTLESLMAASDIDHVDVLFVDIQGAEIPLLEKAQDVLRRGAVRFVVVSTHDPVASGDPMTHRKAEKLLLDAGAHIICEHSVSESVSGDGLIVASFDKRDKKFTVPLTYARAVDSLFGEWEPRWAWTMEQLDYTRQQLQAAEEKIANMEASQSWRLTAPLRALRRLGPRGR